MTAKPVTGPPADADVIAERLVSAAVDAIALDGGDLEAQLDALADMAAEYRLMSDAAGYAVAEQAALVAARVILRVAAIDGDGDMFDAWAAAQAALSRGAGS